jgi:hypothetical protein
MLTGLLKCIVTRSLASFISALDNTSGMVVVVLASPLTAMIADSIPVLFRRIRSWSWSKYSAQTPCDFCSDQASHWSVRSLSGVQERSVISGLESSSYT